MRDAGDVVGITDVVGGPCLLLLPSEGEEDKSNSKESTTKEVAKGSQVGNCCTVWVGASTPEEGNKDPANVK